MNVVLVSANIQNQAVKIYTDVENEKSNVICPISAVLSPSASFATLAGDFTNIAIDGNVLTQNIPESVKTHAFTLTVNSALFSGSVA